MKYLILYIVIAAAHPERQDAKLQENVFQSVLLAKFLITNVNAYVLLEHICVIMGFVIALFVLREKNLIAKSVDVLV